MRTLARMTTSRGEEGHPHYIEGGKGNLGTVLEEVLGFEGLEHIELHHKSGMVTTYTAWEYECDICGSYDHSTEAHPEPDLPHPEEVAEEEFLREQGE